jgi:CheY-like chemotaxis protein
MEEASEQQRKLIADLQAQVLEIKRSVEGVAQPAQVAPEPTRVKERAFAGSVLWVDDQPKNNSYFVQQLTDKGVNVDLALSTSDGLRLFGKKAYSVIISDMGRTEDGTYKPTAGLELVQQIRAGNKTVPLIIFCSSRGVREHTQEAISLGATAITSSPTEMFGILQTAFGEKA